MSSIYRKRDWFYYSTYTTDEKGKRKKVAKSLRTKDEAEAIELQKKWDRYYERKEENPTSLTVAEAKAKYIAHRKRLVEADQLSERTVVDDKSGIKRFMEWLEKADGPRFIDECDHLVLSDFKNSRLNDVSPTTVAVNLRHIQGLFTWLHKQQIIDKHPYEHLDIPKTAKRTVIPLEKDWNEIKRVSAELVQSTPEPDWVHLLVYILVNTGMRIGEVMRIKWEAGPNDHGTGHSRRYVYLRNRDCVIYFKKRQRVVPFSHIWDVISRLPRSRNPFVFGSPLKKDAHIRVDHASRCVSSFLSDDLGMNDKYSAHALRHGAISEWVRNGHSLTKIGKLVGHSTSQISETYAHLVPSDFDGMFN